LVVAETPGTNPVAKGQFFECWYAGPNNRPGHKELISGGTFAGRNGTFTMSAAADPDTYQIMQITQEQAGEGSQHGKIILSGAARRGPDR
jgi:hypothetical protein